MIVRVVAYGTASVDASVEWGRERAEDLRALPGVERFDFVSQKHPPRAGAIVYFTSREHYEAYREERLPELQREIEATSWAKGLAFEHVFELEDI